MSENLVIVESPAKGATIQKYLGKGFTVLASYGHVRDLIPKEGAVDPEHGYAMKYEVIDRNQRHVDAIVRALKKADTLYLATDPDREGEAISWHLYELLNERGALVGKTFHRVVFHEITKRAVQEAVANPRKLSYELIDAQQARRALDYLVGFKLSPLLWRKIKPKLSAGRVQSPALRMICEREDEIEQFVTQEYWHLTAFLTKGMVFQARLHTLDHKRLEQFDINNETQAHTIRDHLLKAANGTLQVTKVEKKERKRYPSPPFTTSTLQQEAVRKLRFSSQRTMRTAQQLYEGIDLGSGPIGLITYMRTDSVTLAGEALADIRSLISQRYGNNKLPDAPRQYKTKSKNAQEAHEAIRPTSAMRLPEAVRPYLSDEQFRLYQLIWQRTVACQMIHATIDTVSVDLTAEPGSFFRATGSTVRDPGFLAVYEEGVDDQKAEKDLPLPLLQEGERVPLRDIEASQHFTEPPPRYTEATLVKMLEEYGIGRPSTYASIISTLQAREYVELDRQRFTPTDMGRIVNRFLTEHFNRYVDYDFTANLEDQLDEVSRGEKDWIPVMDAFWKPFSELVGEKMDNVQRSDVLQSRELGTDPKSGKPVSVRLGRFGPLAQIGAREDEDKVFASLRPGMKIDTITLDEALELFRLPRHLGEVYGQTISTNIGRCGPYIRYGSNFVSLKKEDDPYTVTLERALQLMEEKKASDLAKLLKDFGGGLQIVQGRWGPFLVKGKIKARLPKDRDPHSVTLEEAQALIIAATPVKATKAASKKATEPNHEVATPEAAPKRTRNKATPAETSTGIPTKKTTKKASAAKATTASNDAGTVPTKPTKKPTSRKKTGTDSS